MSDEKVVPIPDAKLAELRRLHAAAEKALLQVGQWDAFTQREKGLMKDALALLARWKEANGDTA